MLQNRPPIVVVLGHVDHGKTTLLDYLRKTSVAAREAGGITQHIRSFQYTPASGEKITFIDTPGHEAFSAMRVRGSKIADIAILVVAADDGVMPQTRQSIEFIKQAGIPFIVAINKMDKQTADPDKIKTQLTQCQIIVEDLGGEVPCVNVSAKTGTGTSELTDLISLISQLNPPQADPEGPLDAVVLESRMDSHVGPTAVVVIKNGTLSVGQSLFQTSEIGKVRNLTNADGQTQKSAGPSEPVEILGLSVVPEVGSQLFITPQTASPKVVTATSRMSADSKLNIVLKTDVAGSQDALLTSIPTAVSVISCSTGDITETDIAQAKASQALVIGFNVKTSNSVSKLAEIDHVMIKNYKIIYELIDFLTEATTSPLETLHGKAEILAEFKIGPDRIAGCRCTEGLISKASSIRILRGDTVVGVTRIKSLKLGKTEVPTVKSGQEFGITFNPYLDFKVTDSIICFDIHGKA